MKRKLTAEEDLRLWEGIFWGFLSSVVIIVILFVIYLAISPSQAIYGCWVAVEKVNYYDDSIVGVGHWWTINNEVWLTDDKRVGYVQCDAANRDSLFEIKLAEINAGGNPTWRNLVYGAAK